MIDRVVHLAERLRAAGFEVSTGEVIDAVEALQAIDLTDRRHVRAALRATLVKEHDLLGRFDVAFDRAVRHGATGDGRADSRPFSGPPIAVPVVGGPVDGAVLAALLTGDDDALGWLAEQAVDRYGGLDGDDASAARALHRVLRAVDLSRMLERGHAPAAPTGRPRRARPADAPPRHRRPPGCVPPPTGQGHRRPDRPADRVTRPPGDAGRRARPAAPVDSRARRVAARPAAVAPPARGRLGRRRRRSTGRVDLRRTFRRSLQSGGVPLDVATRPSAPTPTRPGRAVRRERLGRRVRAVHIHLGAALHAEVRDTRSFAFVGGVAEVTDVLRGPQFDIPINRFVERRGVLGLDGHSDYGAVFHEFREQHLDAVVGDRTTLVIAGDARGNHHPPGADDFAVIARRARRVLWLNPEPAAAWGRTDSLIDEYRANCTAVKEVRTLASSPTRSASCPDGDPAAPVTTRSHPPTRTDWPGARVLPPIAQGS